MASSASGGASARRQKAARIAALYLIFSTLWIYASDRLLAVVVHDAGLLASISIVKGVAFVAVTTLLLYLVLRGWDADGVEVRTAGSPTKSRVVFVVFLGLVLTVPAIDYGIIHLHGPQVRADASEDLAAIADLKARQIKLWLDAERRDAEVLATSEGFIDDLARWRRTGDVQARSRVARRLETIKELFRQDIGLLDENGRPLMAAEADASRAGDLVRRTLLRAALNTGQVQVGKLFRDVQGRVRLDFVVPLIKRVGGAPTAVAVMHAPVDDFLFPFIQTWPTPSPSAETLLVRREGDKVQFLNELRHRRGTAMTFSLPLDSPDLPAAIALRYGRAQTVEGRDYRVVSVLAAVRPVQGTPWFVVAKVDRAEVLRPLHNLVFWVSLVSLAAVAAVSATLFLLWRQEQRNHRLELMAQAADKDRLLKLFYDLPFIGMAITDPATRHWLHVNDRLCEILGYSREELLATGWDRLTHPDDLADELDRFKRLQDGAIEAYTLDKRFLRPDRSVVESGVNVRCVRRLDGSVEHVVMTVRDIGDRKAFEQALLDRVRLRDQLAKTAASVPGVIYSYRLRPDGSACMPYASPSVAGLSGFSPEQLARDAAPMLALIHPDDIARVRNSIAESVRTMLPWRDEFRYRHPAKGEVWIEGQSMPQREADGGILWHGYIQDATERKLGEEKLRIQMHLTKSITDCAADCIFATDEKGRTTFVNPEAERLFGFAADELMGKVLHEVIHHHRPDGRPYPFSECPNCRIYATGESVRNREAVFFRRDGSQVTVMCSNAPLELGGEPTGAAVLVVHDITDLKRAEAALREADRRKDEFLAMLAHELRNPLTPIRNAAHVLGRLDLAEPRIQWVREIIEGQVAHLTRLVDELLEVSRIVQGKISLRRETMQVSELVRQALEAARPLMEAKGHRFEVELPPEGVWVEGDPVRLVQVLQNLLDNAAKYTADGGHIQFRARVSGREIELAVRDDGPGIPPELLPRVFDIFFQGERTLDRAQGGLGIGLTLVQKLVQLHGGTVEASSAGQGLGSVFTVRLPMLETTGLPSPTIVTEPDRGTRSLRVLVVDDDADVAESTAVLLQLEGHEVRRADSGAVALELIPEFRPQVVLLDIGLPGEDGYTVARRIRELPGGGDLMLLAMSGYGHQEALARTREAGFDRHLVKPVNPDMLCALLAGAAGPERKLV